MDIQSGALGILSFIFLTLGQFFLYCIAVQSHKPTKTMGVATYVNESLPILERRLAQGDAQ